MNQCKAVEQTESSLTSRAMRKFEEIVGMAEEINAIMERKLEPIMEPPRPCTEGKNVKEREVLPPLFDELDSLSDKLRAQLRYIYEKIDMVRL